jgi:hypothetical protein
LFLLFGNLGQQDAEAFLGGDAMLGEFIVGGKSR